MRKSRSSHRTGPSGALELDVEEMYGEFFDIPEPLETVFIGWFNGGEVFRSGVTFRRGLGNVFYFQPDTKATRPSITKTFRRSSPTQFAGQHLLPKSPKSSALRRAPGECVSDLMADKLYAGSTGTYTIAKRWEQTIECTLCEHSIVMNKKNVPWHILAPRRGCFGNHLPAPSAHPRGAF